jgi:2-dehydro-3-deoxy-D-arabinonate dehydratase
VPEPELAVLINPRGGIVGYTIADDVSSRDIEGENPLYLPQAKVYDGSCALGPGILIQSQPLSPDTGISLRILRSGATVFSESIAISAMKREISTLVEFLFRDQTFAHGCFLLTGTGIVPPDSFGLSSGDEVRIGIEKIGELTNTVE